MPAVRPASSPAAKAGQIPPSVVGSVALLVVGTGLEWIARRLARNAAGAAGRAIVGQGQDRLPANQRKNPNPESVSVDELVYVRRVQLRR
jgi:hypothetical protein